MQPVLESLPPATFIAKGAHDPLVHNTQDLFWYHVEPYFKPIGIEELELLEPVHVETPAVPALGSATSKEEPSSLSDVLSHIRSYPLSSRLTAAFLDEGKGDLAAAKNVRSGLTVEETWIGSAPDLLQEFNEVWEDRIRNELLHADLLDPEEDNEVLSEIRLGHRHLRNINAVNTAAQRELASKVMSELDTQAMRREKKRHQDHVEILYLEKMIEKGGKRGKGRFSKLLNQMHPNRNAQPGEPLHISKFGAGTLGDGAVSKKRKKKSLGSEKPAPSKTEQTPPPITDASDNLAPHIADIIWKHNNQAPIDEIVKEFLERVPQLAGDMKEARRRITNCMSFSRKPFRFRKQADGVTYSATRV